MKKSLAIIGAGAWGSALAIALSEKFEKIFLKRLQFNTCF